MRWSTDGRLLSASTCTIFSRLLRDLAGVKHIAMGGRATAEPIQAVGGVKGTNNWGWDYVQYNVALAYAHADAEEQAFFNTTPLANYNDQLPFLRAAAGTTPNVNFRDGIPKGDFEERVPAQFLYEEADCRLYWTREMTVDVEVAWGAVAEAAWGGGGGCVGGNETAARGGARKRTEGVRKRGVVVGDYPLDLWTDLGAVDLGSDGLMMP